MKLKTVILNLMTVLALSTATANALAWGHQHSGYSSYWQLSGSVNVSHYQVSFSAVNNTGRPIYCSGYVYGQSNFGEEAYTAVNGWFPPGAYINGYVSAWGNRFMVNGWTNVDCRF